MSLASKERGRTARNVCALSAAGTILSFILGSAHIAGAKQEGDAIAKQEDYNVRQAYERAAYQQELDRQTPDVYTMNGIKLVPKATYLAGYPREPLMPMRMSQEAHNRTGKTLFGFGGLAAVIAAGAAYFARRQRKDYEWAQTRSAMQVTTAEIAALALPPPRPSLHGTPVHQTLAARRAAQLTACEAPFDPFAPSFNHEAVGLMIPEAPRTQPIAA